MASNTPFRETCYPSGHTTYYVVFFGYLGLLVFLYVSRKNLRKFLYLFFASIILPIGLSRLYLHVHWFSDIVAGYLLGFAILATLLFVRYKLGSALANIKKPA